MSSQPPPGYIPPGPSATIPTPPPGLVIPPPPGGYVPTTPEGYTGEATLELSPKLLGWVPAGALTLAFVLTFFSWVGAYPGGHGVYLQSPWYALGGWVKDPTLDPEAHKELLELRKEVPLNVVLLFPYFVCLFAALALAWVERSGKKEELNNLHPRWIPEVTSRQVPLMTAFAVAALVLLTLQTWRGFGLQEAADARIAAKVAEIQQQGAKDNHLGPVTPFQIGEAAGRYSVSTTTALSLVLLAHVVAVVALLGRLWLDHRGPTLPLPRVVAYW